MSNDIEMWNLNDSAKPSAKPEKNSLLVDVNDSGQFFVYFEDGTILPNQLMTEVIHSGPKKATLRIELVIDNDNIRLVSAASIESRL